MRTISCDECQNKGKNNTIDGTPICEGCQNYHSSQYEQKDEERRKR